MNISLVVVSLSLYIFMYLDLNNTVEHAHEIEIAHMQGEKDRMRRLFDQTATAFVSAVEMKDDFTEGNAVKVAEYAKRLAEYAGKSSEECDKVNYAALLHDVGLIGIPDEVIQNSAHPNESDRKIWQKKPEIGAEILSSITEYPYLSVVARYSHERYDGSGYPTGLKGEEIPEIARIIAVADAYVSMTSRQRYREAHPEFQVREAFIEGKGEVFDPVYAGFMVELMDTEGREKTESFLERLEKEISCTTYRQNVSAGIPVERDIIRISFECEMPLNDRMEFASPSIVLFDAYDGRTHDSAKTIESYRYQEYGEVWFDKYSITTAARKMSEKIMGNAGQDEDWSSDSHYEIRAGRLGDHLRLVLRSKDFAKEVIVALPSGAKAAYIGLTGENCRLKNILVESTGEKVGIGEIPRIVEDVSYIDHLESDIGNVQVDRLRSACSEGIEVRKKVRLTFHSMSLPGADLVWHCPYVVLYSSDNGRTDGEHYREYALVKLNGENEATEKFAENNFRMKREEAFPGWDEWKKNLQKGMDFKVALEKRGNRVTLKTDNLGIAIENTSVIREDNPKVYAALTGDMVALTDIRLDLD